MASLPPGQESPAKATAAGPLILIFVDGFGWGLQDPLLNPFLSYGGSLFAFPPAAAAPVPLPLGGWARPIDAVLQVEGLPQSATGQTTLLTGINAQRLLGRHLTGFPDAALRRLLLKHSLLKTSSDRGRRTAFLNAYRPRFFGLPRQQQLRMSATTVANLAAGLPFRGLDDLRERRCLYQEFTNQALRDRGFEVPLWTPAEAGRILAAAARPYDFVLFEYFQTDRVGHAQDMVLARRELQKLDEFMTGLLTALGPGKDPEGDPASDPTGGTLVLLTSDHGNLEDLSTRQHTPHPVPLLGWGCGAAELLREVTDLTGVAPAITSRLATCRPRPSG